MLMTSKIHDHTKYIRTFLQALGLYFHYDEWDFVMPQISRGGALSIC